MPWTVLSWLPRLLPEWFLPPRVILKQRNPERADSYENEIDTYERLRPLRGTRIPRFLGEVAVLCPAAEMRHQISQRPTPAILLEHIEGVALRDLAPQELGNPSLVDRLQALYGKLTEQGVVHGDPELHKFLRLGDESIVAIDFEFAHPLPSTITNEDELETLKTMMRRARGEEDVHPGSDLVIMVTPAGRMSSHARWDV